MITRIDRLLGTEIFESFQSSVPRNIGIMIGMAHTSGRLVTGKRRYETCTVCREIINPCFLNRAYTCAGCKSIPLQLCTGATGNKHCEDSDKKAGEDAKRTNMTVLYRCHFGLANYAIAAQIGGLGSIIIYGGQFHIHSDESEVLIEEFDKDGRKMRIYERDFTELVLAINDWLISPERNYSTHLPRAERDRLLTEYLSSPSAKKSIEMVVGENEKSKLSLRELEDLLLRRYNLSLFEAWREFLTPPSESEIRQNRKDLNSYHIISSQPRDSELVNAATDALDEYDEKMCVFLLNPQSPDISETAYGDAVITLAKALSTIELLKNLALLISRTADIVFYKDTYLRLKNLWDNHPLSVVESYDDRWRECATHLQKLTTTAEEIRPAIHESNSPENKRVKPKVLAHAELAGRLNRSLMLFAYKLLVEDFRSLVSILHYNYDIARNYEREEPQVMSELIDDTEVCLRNLKTASCLFVRDLLESKYEQLVKDSTRKGIVKPKSEKEGSQTTKELTKTYNDIKNLYFDLVERIGNRLEEYFTSKGVQRPEPLDAGEDPNNMVRLQNHVFGLLQRASREKWIKTEEEWIRLDDIMLRFFDLVFARSIKEDEDGRSIHSQGKNRDEKHGKAEGRLEVEEQLLRIGVNLRWADTELREQIENIPTGVLQFDICQSLLRFVQKLREFAYSSRFEVLEKLAATASENGFETEFMDPARMSCKYFIDHGINHVREVLANTKCLIEFAQDTALAKDQLERKDDDQKGSVCSDNTSMIVGKAEHAEESFKNVCESPIWQYYVKCAALFHDVGMFSQQWHEELYGGPATVRRCHGAFSGKRIVEERRFDIIGNELDKRLVAQICTYHQGSCDINALHKNLQPLVAILRVADELHVGANRIRNSVNVNARNEQLETEMYQLRNEVELLRQQLSEEEKKILEAPVIAPLSDSGNPKKEEKEVKSQIKRISKFEEEVLALARKRSELDAKDIWPKDVSCFQLVYRHPKYAAGLATFVSILKRCSEIKTLLEAPLHYQKHLSIDRVRIDIMPKHQGAMKKYLVPTVTVAHAPVQYQGIRVTSSGQPWIIASRVRAKFQRELETVKDYLEPVGIRFKRPRVQKDSKSRNLLFIAAPASLRKTKFVGAPTSLLYVIAPVSNLVDSSADYIDVNIEIWDPEHFDNAEKKELRDILLDLNPRIVGISNTSASHSNAIEIANTIRNVVSDAVIIFGGAHENVCFYETINNHSSVDISIGGVEEPLNTNATAKNNTVANCCASISHCADGEGILLRIIEGILNKNLSRNDLPAFLESLPYNEIQGTFSVAFLDSNKKPMKRFGKNKLDLNSLPFQARHLLNDHGRYDYEIFREEITGRMRKTAQVITTRGCIHRCIFCSSVGKSARRTVNNVVEELEELKEQGYEAIFFDDSTFGDKCGEQPSGNHGHRCSYTEDVCPKVATEEELREEMRKAQAAGTGMPNYVPGRCGYAIKLCDRMFRENFGYVWGCQTRADIVHNNSELLDIMKKAGCIYVYFGVESLDDGVLKKMCKDIINPEQIIEGIRQTRNKGMHVGISLVFGLEGEDENTVRGTIGGVAELLEPAEDPSSRVSCISINIATVYPGTKLEERFKEKAKDQIPNFDKPPMLDRYPFNEFEDAGRNLLPCFIFRNNTNEADSERLAILALEESRKAFGKSLV